MNKTRRQVCGTLCVPLKAGMPLKRTPFSIVLQQANAEMDSLPSTARRLSPTAICPADPAALDLFAELGSVFPVETEKDFDAICATTATIASYFAFVEGIASWLAQQGIPESKARDYIARLFFGLTTTTIEAPERSFQSFAANHATAGGINEQFLKLLVERGLLTSVSEALAARRFLQST